MKTFISVGLDIEGKDDPTLVVFVAENEEEAVLAIAKEILGPLEIEDFEENGEPGDEISDFVPLYIMDDYPVVIAEFATPMKSYVDAKSLDLGYWYGDDVLPLLEKKYPKK